MSDSCLSCSELETKICTLAEELSSAESCGGLKVTEAGTTFDYSGQLQAKRDVLSTYRSLYNAKRCGEAQDLYEFVHVPCVAPVNCEGSGCGTGSMRRGSRRRYRR